MRRRARVEGKFTVHEPGLLARGECEVDMRAERARLIRLSGSASRSPGGSGHLSGSSACWKLEALKLALRFEFGTDDAPLRDITAGLLSQVGPRQEGGRGAVGQDEREGMYERA